MRLRLLICLSVLCSSAAYSQVLTKEDSLAAGLIASNNATVVSGYGNARYEANTDNGQATVNLDRIVLFVGHKFNKKVSFFSELELEDAKIEGGSPSGEISMEQAFIKMNYNKNNYFVAGLFIPRIGIINENHLPTTFSSNRRPFVEKYVIPATWRELGIGYYGTSTRIAGLNYTLALLNGLNCASFENGEAIRGGRFEGKDASASALALTGSILHYYKNLRSQVSAYYGGSAGISNQDARNLNLKNGVFGTPVGLYEANVQYTAQHLHLKALGCLIQIKDASKINNAFGNDTPEQVIGGYAEAGYKFTTKKETAWMLFSRYEYMDLNQKVPDNTTRSNTLNRQYIVSGITYQPAPGVLIKLDHTYQVDADQNKANYLNFGIGYSF